MKKKIRWKIRRTGICLASVLFLTSVPTCVRAEEASSDYVQGYETEENSLKLYIDNVDGGEIPEASAFTVKFGGTLVPVTDVADSREAAVSWYCLVDVSGSVNADQFAQETEALRAIGEKMSRGDSMVIGTLGNSVTATELLTDKEAVGEAIEALEVGHEDTNLYAGIVGSLQKMEQMTSLNRKKCLVLLSDGEDEQKTGFTKDEAYEAIKNSSIPVYTLAALPVPYSKEQNEFGKELGSFARMSAGGQDFMPVEDGTDGTYVGNAIVEDMRQGLILTLDISDAVKQAGQKDELLLRISFQAEDGSVREDTCYVYADDLIYPEPESKSESEQKPESEAKPEPESEPENGRMMIAGVLVVLVLVLGAVLTIIRKKNAPASEDAKKEPEKREEDSGAGNQPPEPLYVEKPELEETESVPVLHPVDFAAIGYAEVNFSLELEENRIYTLGRNSRAELILNPEDKKLSGIHCKVRWRNGALDIWDTESTNGTFVNGVSIRKLGMATVENGQTVRLGSYEYRVITER